MKEMMLLAALACGVACAGAADEHPKAAELRRYIDRNPIEPRVLELLIPVSQKSSDLNDRGYQAYRDKRYEEAITRFREAIECDDDNSFAWYNMACAYSLMGDRYYGHSIDPLKNAVRREWFWGLKLMVDPDLDVWRGTNLSLAFREASPFDPECTALIHTFRPDGTVTIQAQNVCAKPPRTIATGYYSVVGWCAFEYFPEVEPYVTEGPDGSYTTPRETNQVRLPDVRLPK